MPQDVPELIRVGGARKSRRITHDRKTRCRFPQTFDGCHALVLSWPVKIDPRGGPVALGESCPLGQHRVCSAALRSDSRRGRRPASPPGRTIATTRSPQLGRQRPVGSVSECRRWPAHGCDGDHFEGYLGRDASVPRQFKPRRTKFCASGR
ncbi:hypothetical protein I548_4491 [Mycobacterium intracellulare]|nr:hypothetical protein I548_4491 [Mycobacterium intracellulare]